ncbi:MAG: hypothetical protein V4595_06795 [Pseudomonadota bacterium]|jgi:outer membrane receptor protein involved in Fe transport
MIIRLCGGYNRAVRAPNTQELFAPQSVQIDGATDPCAALAVGGLVNGNMQAQCALTGVPASRFGLVQDNPSEQYKDLVGSDVNLKLEKANTFTAGVILRPSFLPGFNLSDAFYAKDARVTAQNYFDLAGTVRVEDKFTFRLGVNNILDNTPPILSATASPIGSFGNGNTYPGIYEAIGRYLFVDMTIDM